MSSHPDLLIVGGGVIGLTTAYLLAREGHKVQLLDKGDFGQEASWAGAGILPPGNPGQAKTPLDQLRARSAALFPMLSAELRERTGMDNGYLRSGGLEFTCAEEEAESNEWRAEGVAVETIAGEALARLEPALAPSVGEAHHLPDMAQVRNPRHLKALLAGCQRFGVLLRPGVPAYRFERQGSKITAVVTDGGQIPAAKFLVAAGAWCDPLLEPLGFRPGIQPVRGQIALLNTRVPLFQRILLWGERYLVPRPDGRVLVGSTEEDAGFDKRTTAGAIGELLSLAARLVPALAEAHVERCWAGLRPESPDGLPYLGQVPGFDNLFLAAGHFRAGLQLSPASGLVMKELLLGKQPSISLKPFRPDRSPTSRSAPPVNA